ncbi:hypothetical protein [Halorarius halobius]|uniref:hypothetical protein n=1 Tax=Halorarius halobius TaxID=2962671 RepID=UPI0020CCF90A|nr:hypothetical protein [Halorarius halobius]
MSEAPERAIRPAASDEHVVLSERQLFELAGGDAVTVELDGPTGPAELTLTVEPAAGRATPE